MRRDVEAEETADLDELSVEDLQMLHCASQKRYDQCKRDEERIRKVLEARRGGGTASATAVAVTDGDFHSAAPGSDARVHLANVAAPKVAEEVRLYYSTQGLVDDTAKQQEVLEKIVARNYRAQASWLLVAVRADGRGDHEDHGGGTVPPTSRPDGGTEAAAAGRSKRRLTESA